MILLSIIKKAMRPCLPPLPAAQHALRLVHDTMRSLLMLCAVLSASAFHAAPAHRQVPLSSRGSVRAAPAMSAPLALATQLAATPISGAELPLPSALVAEGIFDVIEGFVGSPLVLLVPIGAGSLVAFGIIFVLVKSAEPEKQS